MGWHVDTDAPTSISTAHRWISTIVQNEHPRAPPQPFALFPVVIRPTGVFMYVIKQSGSALCRESEENIAPGDYGIYNEDGSQPSVDYIFTPIPLSYSSWGASFEEYSVALAKKAALPRSIADQVLARDKGCVFTGVSLPTSDSEKLEVTWIFPPFLGYTLSGNQRLQRAYHDNPDSCDLSEFMVATNAVSGCRDVVALFYDNKLGIDVDDSYRIVVFDKSEHMANAAPFKSHVTFVDVS